ncbi:Eco57I restriction-modification methylase domain-containing protein [Acidimangrovimonas pyrenivorans]|uniref:site-specific DNA-methyltransferase (adenine-specific) n=1 Tax=Acidimangrovimonas pyrenivorans TaxID=2030798 RepID=A0ABV7AD75_9RHOB
MVDTQNSFLSRSFLRSVWAHEFETFKDSPEEVELLERLTRWAGRGTLKETSAQAALLEEFFHATWGYVQAGQVGGEANYTLYPAFPVAGAGQRGGMGEADAALGFFAPDETDPIPQVLVEFKDIKSALDAPQKRKGNSRSPVKQGLDYLYASRKGMFGYEPIIPTWAIITDMNEFRLYWADRGERQFISFALEKKDLLQNATLLNDTDEGRFDRFLFSRLFHRDTLIVRGISGRAELLSLIQRQRFRQSELENRFYAEYRGFREHLYRSLLKHNGPSTDRFPGTKGRLVRMAQKILDRAIFVFFCEDMGHAPGFPPQLLRDYLVRQADDQFFDPKGGEIWQWLRRLFTVMNDGQPFGGHRMNKFNGGLFAPDLELEKLHIPNSIFCERGQGQNEASLAANKLTLLYLSANYNYASSWGEGVVHDEHAPAGKRDPERSIGLYTLGRIFEQSITELEILEAEEEGRKSINKESKRKRDGVYYTPEWVVERIVDETVGRRLADLKAMCGWPSEKKNKLPSLEAIDAYEVELRDIRIVDPACGSGAFLITTLAYLLDEWKALRDLRRQLGQKMAEEDWTDAAVREILRRNLYGVDINPASVEITKLALWLHTARSDKPLSSLDSHIRDGNSLIGPEFYNGLAPYSEDEKERINAFDWQAAFPGVFERGGFDVVVGNPPYVKLQNFRKVHADMAAFLSRDPKGGGAYCSTQTGNFDLYLPFVEKGIQLLNDNGRLGYIAPSVWQMNEYGAGLRGVIEEGRHLWGWIDFGSHQIFDEATVYTALQFFSKRPNDEVAVVQAPNGVVAESPWEAEDIRLSYDRLKFGDRWLLVTGAERDLIDKLTASGLRLDDPAVTRNIFVGIQTSADHIYHLKRLGPNRYEEKPPKGAKRGRVVEIEDEIMKPLVSGPEASRYLTPQTDTYLLFPYSLSGNRPSLVPANTMRSQYPNAWAYLIGHEEELRARESNKMDLDDGWWAYNYPKNLDKQEAPKLLVAQTVRSMQVSADGDGAFYINNVRVNGIMPARGVSLWSTLAALNAKPCDFYFRKTAKPKDNGYFEANKQFIKYLPLPVTDGDDNAALAGDAERLQELYDHLRQALDDIARRMGAVRIRPRPDEWLFPDLPGLNELKDAAPKRLIGNDRRKWAKERLARELEARHAALEERLEPGVPLAAELKRGELRFLIDGIPAITGIFPSPDQAPFILAQWKVLASRTEVTARMTGKKLAMELRKISLSAEDHIMADVIRLQDEIAAAETEIATRERRINQTIYRLHDLSPGEIAMIEAKVH